ncbi:nuclear transport factor 2 family protein [Shinella sp. G-2]|uniref:nuclear transport factor 2 family protein n=1 Tax=Shinella sp. G-2 TaxID=3133141 RepID=UPI003CFD300A
MESSVRAFFERYERLFNQSLGGDADMEDVAALYATDFIAASPAGVAAGKNDGHFREAMTEGYARYRDIGTKEMRIRDIRLSPIDDRHCLAHVAWTALYTRADQPDIAIDFDVHYLVQMLDGQPKVFGWVSGDEQALLKAHGVI